MPVPRPNLIAILTAVAIAFGTGAVVTSASAGPATTPEPPKSWAAEWMIRDSGTYSAAEAQAIALRYDHITAHPDAFRGRVAAMRNANPDLRLHVYVNGAFAARYLPDYPETWYAHNAAGHRVLAVRFGTYLMNVHMPNWQNEVVRLCDEAISTSGYDGCFIDSLGNGQLASDYLDSDPIDPRTGATWDLDTWIGDTADLVTRVRDQRPALPISVNGIGNGSRYFGSATHALAAASPLAMAESFTRGATASAGAWPGINQWRQEVDMIVDAESGGTGILAVTKLWTSASEYKKKQWYGYSMGTFLLGAGDHSRMYFLKDGCAPPCGNTASPLASQWTLDVPLGSPLAKYRAAGSAFVRDFENGFVAVNPTSASATVTVPAGSFLDQDGNAVAGTLTLGAHRGAILTPAPDAGAPTCDGLVATIIGTPGDDVLVGTAGPDVIRGFDGNDVIDGGGGDDVICGDYGNDTLRGGEGNNRIFGSNGNDIIEGGPENDYLAAGSGDDEVTGGTGDDKIIGSQGADALVGGGGSDAIYGKGQNDRLTGGSGTDLCHGGGGTDTGHASCETNVDIER